MIPQAELDRALARWKARSMGLSDAPTPVPTPIGVAAPHGSDSFEPESTDVGISGAPGREYEGGASSGIIAIGDGDFDEQL